MRPLRPPFAHRPKSRTITRRRYPEEWAWWAASGWGMMVEDGEGGTAHLHTYKDNRPGFTLWGARATPAETANPDAVRRFLAATLYYHLHPRKSAKAFALTGLVCTDEELAAFIRQQRRKASNSKP